MTRHQLLNDLDTADKYWLEVLRLEAFGRSCLDESPWSVTRANVALNYARFRASLNSNGTAVSGVGAIWDPWLGSGRAEAPRAAECDGVEADGICWALGAMGKACGDVCGAFGFGFADGASVETVPL